MDIRGMHYDIKTKLNKVDSQQYINLRVPEIDWSLNEAIDIFIKNIAEPRVSNNSKGFEINQRAIDDLRTLVVNDAEVTPVQLSNNTYLISLPIDYMFYISCDITITKNACSSRKANLFIRQHDDRFETSPFDNSSFEWKVVNARFYKDGLKIFTDGTFQINSFKLNYIKKHPYVHNAQDFKPTNSYILTDGTLLTGFQNCILPDQTHREIVDIATLVLTGNLQIPDYQIKQAKISLNN